MTSRLYAQTQTQEVEIPLSLATPQFSTHSPAHNR